jgi:hypothetical protein
MHVPTHPSVFVALIGALAACGGSPSERTTVGASSIGSGATDSPATSGEAESGGAQGSDPQDSADETAAGAEDARFDVGDGSFCDDKGAGIFCDDRTAITCDGNGTATETTDCVPGLCVEGEGCVTCSAGQWSCKGPRVMTCNDQGVPYWEEVAVCDPAANQFCDVTAQGCAALYPIGDIEPTGEYYLYSTFMPTADGFTTVSDVDSFGNRIWFVAWKGGALTVGGYDVQLLDSDGDGVIEPHQHPLSKDQTGPIEERVFTYAQEFPISNGGSGPHQMELHATATTLSYAGPTGITEYDLATGVTSQFAPKSAWIGALTYSYLAFLGYDDVNDVWYSGNETARRVFQYDAETMTWGYAFEFPVLAGDHMDGMDVVTDQRDGTPYVYVSDMTSNFIGQYRHDPVEGWVQENLFSYAEDTGVPVEGFGFGALNHFWVGGWEQNSFYEIGGGDLTEFLDPPG